MRAERGRKEGKEEGREGGAGVMEGGESRARRRRREMLTTVLTFSICSSINSRNCILRGHNFNNLHSVGKKPSLIIHGFKIT